MEEAVKEITLGSRSLSRGTKDPYIIAEIGVNHECQMDRAKKLIDEALEGGADAAKFQAYKAETITCVESPAYWDLKMEPTKSQFELFKKYDHFGKKEYAELAHHCETIGIDFCCTPFDFASADFLNDLAPFCKISSSDLTNLPFLRHIAKKEKPIVLSTGASDLSEIDLAVRTMRRISDCDLVLLHCVLNYPCAVEAANLNTIHLLKNVYPDLVIGYSDHVKADPRMLTLTYAYQAGAVVIEKHFTDDKSRKGNDHAHSMDKHDLKTFRENVKIHHVAMGDYSKKDLSNEVAARKHARRSIVAAVDLKVGDLITAEKITFKRPAHGISPALVDHVLGSEVALDTPADTPLTFDRIKSLVQPPCEYL